MGPFGVPIIPFVPFDTPLPEPTKASPMHPGLAAQTTGHALRDFVMARKQKDRDDTHETWYWLKFAFKQTYGKRAWAKWFDWIVDEWGLDDYIFDRDALRDS